MKTRRQTPSDDVAALKAALLRAEAELAVARAKAADDQALIAHQKLQIEKLNRALYGFAADNYLGRLSDNYDGRYDCPLGPDIRRGGAPTGDRPQRAAA